MRCLDPGNFKLKEAITFSCNTYFANVMQRTINNPQFGSVDSALRVWNYYMRSFGLGHKLGIDMPSELPGLLPTPELYDKIYGRGHWNFCTFRSVSIGQGEVNVTPLQIANEMAYIANKGWYITPHMVDSIDGGDKYGLLDSFKLRHQLLHIPDSIFEAVYDGMEGVMERGTAAAAKVPGVVVCGKTGTVENYYKGVKQKDHAVFAAFAPRDDPKIAIAVICENAGFGSTSSAPIASLMIEQYLKDSIPEPDRLARVEQISKMDLMPARILDAIRQKDSIHRANVEKMRLKKLNDSLELRKQQQGGEEAKSEKVAKRENKLPVTRVSTVNGILPEKVKPVDIGNKMS
jgi:penicillin-binding protein 2